MLKRYAAETKGRVKDRMMLIIEINHNGTDIRKVVRSLGKYEPWGYKWHAGYIRADFDNLDDRPHTGRQLLTKSIRVEPENAAQSSRN